MPGTEVDAGSLAASLRRHVEGDVLFDEGGRALYATDASNYRQVPIGVVRPRHLKDVVATVALAREHGAPILSRGGGTSLAGQCCNEGVVMDMSRYLRHIDIDAEKRLATVEAGCVLDELRAAANDYGLTFGPDPATHNHCTLGGMLGNNSCGVHSILAEREGTGARTSDNTHKLEVLTYDGLRTEVGPTSDEELRNIVDAGGRRGEIYRGLRDLRDSCGDLVCARYPKIPRRVSGYNLDDLLPEKGMNVARALVGSESTCVTILTATLHLIPLKKTRVLLVLGFDDIAQAGDHVPDVLAARPCSCEGIDELLFDWVKRGGTHPHGIELMPPGNGWLLVEFDGDTAAEAEEHAKKLVASLSKNGHGPASTIIRDPKAQTAIWKVRESSLGSTAWVAGHPDTWEGWEDSAVPPAKVGPYLRDLRKLMDEYGYHPSLYGHLGDGCVHCRISFDLTSAAGITHYHAFVEAAADLVLSYGGSLSGEHGDGQSRAELLPKMFGNELVGAFERFKSLWDPEWKMNPGKVVRAHKQTENLRLGVTYRPPDPPTTFAFPSDKFTFARAALRCVGIGECRKEGEGTMCPSYRVTRDEKHSTRGRARLLWEMLNGELKQEGWRSEPVREALDLCLACKGCKGECPVHVDMATYKAEFLSHYYAGRLRPRSAYALGLIRTWSDVASLVPWAANFFTQTPGLSAVAKLAAGIHPSRRMPKFAGQTFRRWFAKEGPRPDPAATPVILWPDTFNDRFHPNVARAAARVLTAAGLAVRLPKGGLCCGRPLYDWGFLDRARRQLTEILEALRPDIRAGTPVVVLEPSCASVFRDELLEMLPHDEDAKRLAKQTKLLSEVLEERAPSFAFRGLGQKAIVQGHCHQKSILGMQAEMDALARAGVDAKLLDSGCCGMAGAFGFETQHVDVARACGERVLLPAVRQADPGTLVVADGFSCHEQIAQETGRTALHLAEVLERAIA